MLFESQLGHTPPSPAESGHVVWDGVVHGASDVWIVVAPATDQPIEWCHPDDALEITPLRVCRAVAGDRLLLDTPDPEHDEMFADLLGIL